MHTRRTRGEWRSVDQDGLDPSSPDVGQSHDRPRSMPLPSARREAVREEPEVDRFRAVAAKLEDDETQQE
jgi:hypothetical protein